MSQTSAIAVTEAPAPRVKVHTFGRFLVEIDGEPLRFETKAKRKPLELLKVLVALGGSGVSTEQLVESLWPDSDGDRAYSAFATTLGRLRKLIGSEPLVLQDGRLTLVADLCWVDAMQVPALLGRAGKALDRGETEAARLWVEQSIELYRGPFLDGEFEPPELLSARERLHGLFLRHVHRLARALHDAEEFERAAELCQQGLEVDDLAEDLYQQLMRCYLEQGRLVQAAAVYQRCQQLFQASVGIDPSPETEAVYRAVLAAQAARKSAPEPDSGESPVPPPAAPAVAVGANNGPAMPAPQDLGAAQNWSADPALSQVLAQEQTGAAPQPSEARLVAAPQAPPAQGASAAGAADLGGLRRTTTVAMYRLHGFAAMNERLDPEEIGEFLQQLWRRAEDVIERHGGVLNQCVLDEQVVLFGIPVSHEDDPQRALEASLAVQALVREMSPAIQARTGVPLGMAAGISTGLILASEQDSRVGRYALAGDPLLWAAALVDTADPDEIAIGPEARRQVAPYYEIEEREPVSVRGREAPIPSFRVGARTEVRTRIEAAAQRGLTPFMGRSHELGILNEALGQALGGSGQVVTVVGAPGLGKSRLLHEFVGPLDRGTCVVMECRALPTGTDAPYQPFREGLMRSLGIRRSETTADAVATARETVRRLDPDLERYLPLYFYLLSIQTPDYPLPANLTGDALSQALGEALTAMCIHSTRRKPVVLILEDWHWADAAASAALRRMTSLVPSHAILVVVTHRPELQLKWGQLSFHTQLVLRPLGGEDTGQIVRSTLGASELPPGLLDRIQEHTSGNPFFVEEICAALLEDGRIRVVNDRAELIGSLTDWAPPDTVQAVIRSRIDRLEQTQQQVLRVASVLGREFDLDLLQRAVSANLPLGPTLEQLCNQDMLQQTRLLPNPAYCFKHVLIQVVAYDTLMLQQRRKLHGLVARSIEARDADRLDQQVEPLAYHYRRSNDSEKAIHYLELVADRAVHSSALETARRQFGRALQLIDALAPGPDLVRKRIEISLKWASASQYAPTLAHIQALEQSSKLAAELGDTRSYAYTTYWRGRMLYVLGQMGQAHEHFDEVSRVAESLGDSKLAAHYLAFQGRYHWHLADYDRSAKDLARAIEALEALDMEDLAGHTQTVLGTQLGWAGDFDTSTTLINQVVESSRATENPSRESAALVHLGLVEALRGNWASAIQLATAGAEQAERLGNAAISGIGGWTRGYALFMQGDREQGLDLLSEIATWPRSGRPGGMLLFRGWYAEALALSGAAREARSAVSQALAMSKESRQRTGLPIIHRAAALAAALRGAGGRDAARQAIQASLDEAAQVGALPDHAIGLFRKAELLHKEGQPKEATPLLREAAAQFKSLGMTWWQAQVAEVLGR